MNRSIEALILDVIKDLEGMAVEIDKKVRDGKAANFEQYKDWTGEARGIRRAKDRLNDRLRKGLDSED